MSLSKLACLALVILSLLPLASAQPGPTHTTAPATKWPIEEHTYVIDQFRFGSGETLPKLTLHYLTLGKLHRNAQGHADNVILLLHGTGGDRYSLLNPVFADELFGPGQLFDIRKYFLVLPDDIGHGDSSKPSDGLHMRFPQYDYDDMVRSQHTMLSEGMHVDHLRLILGTSMGCMQSWVWGETYPTFMDALAPFACYPVEIAGRNRVSRYLAIEDVRHDPAWNGGEYKTEPLEALRAATGITMIQGSAPIWWQEHYPTRVSAEQYVDNYMARALPGLDANDLLYYYNASRNYNPEPKLSAIQVPALWINSGDDYINPPEVGAQVINPRVLPKMPKTKYILIPASHVTRGHGTHTTAALWKSYLSDFMKQTEPK